MKRRITEISILQTSKIAAIVYAPLGLLGGLALFASTGSAAAILWSPLLYCVGGFFATAMSAALYNILAKRFGGFEFFIEAEPFSPTVPISSLWPTSPEREQPPTNLDEELRKVAKLKEDGLITEDEFNQKKKAILGI